MENNNGLDIFNGPLPTSEEGKKIAQEMEQKKEENNVYEETNEVPIVESTNNVEASETIPVEEQVITSGTATEEEIEIDATKVPDEVLDEEEIKKDVKEENERTSKNIWFIIITIGIIAAFIAFLPYIIKTMGM